MIGVILDTNILVSALLTSQGLSARVFLRTLQDQDMRLCVSAEVFSEYEEVLHRTRFNFTVSAIAATLDGLREKGFGSNRQRS